MASLNQLTLAVGHVIAKEVESEFVVGSIGNVALILLATFLRILSGNNTTGGHSKGAENATHKFTLVTGKEVVHGHNVNTATGNRV